MRRHIEGRESDAELAEKGARYLDTPLTEPAGVKPFPDGSRHWPRGCHAGSQTMGQTRSSGDGDAAEQAQDDTCAKQRQKPVTWLCRNASARCVALCSDGGVASRDSGWPDCCCAKPGTTEY